MQRWLPMCGLPWKPRLLREPGDSKDDLHSYYAHTSLTGPGQTNDDNGFDEHVDTVSFPEVLLRSVRETTKEK